MKQPCPDVLNLFYYNYPNVGDSMSKVLFEELFGICVSHQEIPSAEMSAIGSILQKVLVSRNTASSGKQPAVPSDQDFAVWGTGLMYDGVGSHHMPTRRLKIYALRGELTRQAMSACLEEEVRCVLADPGLLASFLVPTQQKKYDIGLIPHYVDAHEECFQKMKHHYPNSILINVREDPLSVIKTIGQCKTILSTSLHGLILADSFGIPNHWCECSDRILGNGFKFRDYYSSYGLDAAAYDLNNEDFPTIDKIKRDYSVPYRLVFQKQYQLLKSFPYDCISKTKLFQLCAKSIYTGLFR